MKIYECDRCGKPCKGNSIYGGRLLKSITSVDNIIVRKLRSNGTEDSSSEYDLCSKCRKELDKWLKGDAFECPEKKL